MDNFITLLDRYGGELLLTMPMTHQRLNDAFARAGIKDKLTSDDAGKLLAGELAVTAQAAEIIATHLNGQLKKPEAPETNPKRDKFLETAGFARQIAEKQGQPIFGVRPSLTRTPELTVEADKARAFRSEVLRQRKKVTDGITALAEKNRLSAAMADQLQNPVTDDSDDEDELPDDAVVMTPPAAAKPAVSETAPEAPPVARDMRALRQLNPEGKADRPSFLEIVESCFDKKMTFSECFKTVMRQWDLWSPRQFTAATKRLVPLRQSIGEKTADTWSEGLPRCSQNSVVISKLVTAYKLDRAAEEKLWKITWGKKLDITDIRHDLAAAKAAGDAKATKPLANALMMRLVEATGIPYRRLESMIRVPEGSITQWQRFTIGKVNNAKRFVDALMTHVEVPPGTLPAEIDLLKTALAELFTARDLSKPLPNAIIDALDADRPVASLIRYIENTGKSRADIAAAAGVSEATLQDIFSGGRNFYEHEAQDLLAIFDWTGMQECDDIMRVLTGYENPEALLKQAVAKHITVKEVLAQTLKRRNHGTNHAGSATILSEFVHKDKEFWLSRYDTARNVGTYLGFSDEDMRMFAVMATGRELVDPLQIVAQVERGEMPRKEAMDILYRQTGRDLHNLAEFCGITLSALNHCMEKGGITQKTAETQFAKALGIHQPKDIKRFRCVFGTSLPEALITQAEIGILEKEYTLRQLLKMTGKTYGELRQEFGVNTDSISYNRHFLANPKLPTMLDQLAEMLHIKGEKERLHLLFDPAYADKPLSYESRRKNAIGSVMGNVMGSFAGKVRSDEDRERTVASFAKG